MSWSKPDFQLVLHMGNLKTVRPRQLRCRCRTVFRILIRCFLRAQNFHKDVAKQLVNRVETGLIKENSTNSNFLLLIFGNHM